jgi:hypothetical protein
MPRTQHPIAARAFEPLALLYLACLVGSGVLLRVGMLRPHNLLAVDVYNGVFSAHNTFTLAAPPLVLLYLAPRAHQSVLLRPVLGTLYLAGALAVGASRPLGAFLFVGASVVFLWRIVVPSRRTPQGLALSLAIVINALGWLGAGFGHIEAMGASQFPVVLAVLVTRFVAVRSVDGIPFPIAIPTYVASRLLVRYWSAAEPLALVALVAGLAIGVGVIKSTRHEGSTWIRWVRRAEAVFFVEGLLGSLLLATVPETHLPDTLFAVGTAHFEAFVLLFAVLRGLGGSPVRGWSWSGLAVAFVGAQVFCGGAIVVGIRGMPRRYVDYLPRFSSIHVVASCGAFILCAGIATIIVTNLIAGMPGEGRRLLRRALSEASVSRK